MVLSRPTHILFVLDHLHRWEPGLYALARWLIRLLRRCTRSKYKILITCTSVKREKDANADSHFVEFIEKNDVTILHPDRYGYGYRGNQSELSIEDLVDRDKQYYRKLKSVSSVTHVVLFAPLSEKACLPGRLVERIKTAVKNKNAPKVGEQIRDVYGDNGVKVVLFNQWSFSQQSCTYVSDILKNVDFVVSVGIKLYAEWNQHIKTSHKLKHICLYPTLDEFSCDKPLFHPAAHFVILTLHSNFLYTAASQEPNDLLRLLSRCISRVAQLVKANNSSSTALTWCIHCPGLDIDAKKRLVNQLEACAHNSDLYIDIETKRTPTQDLIDKCSLCIQSGDLDRCGFSGLETLLCGIPTLVLSDSDVGRMIREVDDMFGEYFTLDNETCRNIEDNAPIWEKRISILLTKKEKTFKRTSELLDKYFGHENYNGEVSTYEGIRAVIKDAWGIQKLTDEYLKTAMMPNRRFPLIEHQHPQNLRSSRPQPRHRENRRDVVPVMASDVHTTTESDSSGDSERDTELKTSQNSPCLSSPCVENLGEIMSDDVKGNADFNTHGAGVTGGGQAIGGVKPKNPERIITIPEIEFEGLISSDEDPDITFGPIKSKPKFLKHVKTFKRK